VIPSVAGNMELEIMQPLKELGTLVRGLHHVAIAVESLDAARATYEHALGFRALPIEFVPDQRVNVLVLFAGTQRVELVEPASPDSPVSKFLATRGPGIHHVAWRVDDLVLAIDTLARAGLRLIDDKPRPGSHGTKVAFVHPKATGGVLMELVEDPAWRDT
jgi:methylmalonyl-CoA epimerase